MIEQHQQKISNRDHLTFAIHDCIMNTDSALHNSRFIAALNVASTQKLTDNKTNRESNNGTTFTNNNSGRVSPLAIDPKNQVP